MRSTFLLAVGLLELKSDATVSLFLTGLAAALVEGFGFGLKSALKLELNCESAVFLDQRPISVDCVAAN